MMTYSFHGTSILSSRATNDRGTCSPQLHRAVPLDIYSVSICSPSITKIARVKMNRSKFYGSEYNETAPSSHAEQSRDSGDIERANSDRDTSLPRVNHLKRKIQELEERRASLERENEVLCNRIQASLIEINRIREMIVQEQQQALEEEQTLQILSGYYSRLPSQVHQDQSMTAGLTNFLLPLPAFVHLSGTTPSHDYLVIPPPLVFQYGQGSMQSDVQEYKSSTFDVQGCMSSSGCHTLFGRAVPFHTFESGGQDSMMRSIANGYPTSTKDIQHSDGTAVSESHSLVNNERHGLMGDSNSAIAAMLPSGLEQLAAWKERAVVKHWTEGANIQQTILRMDSLLRIRSSTLKRN